MYYLRTRAAVDAIKFTVDQGALAVHSSNSPAPKGESSAGSGSKPASASTGSSGNLAGKENSLGGGGAGAKDPSQMTEAELAQAKLECSRENPEGCLMCSG